MTDLRPTSTSSQGDEATDLLFAGPGEMRAICREFDWSTTSLGPVSTWSRSLCNSIRTIMAARCPAFLWVGPDLVQIFNDAYRPSLGEGDRHVQAVGAKGAVFWAEIWPIIGPQIAQVLAGGEATWNEDQLVPITRNGRVEDVYWTYGYSALFDDDGAIDGVLVLCQETTSRVLAEREQARLTEETARADRRAARILEQVGDEHLTMDADFRILSVNDSAVRNLGMPRETLIGRTHWDAFPASVGTAAETQYRRAMRNREETHFAHRYVGEGYDRHLEIDVYPTDDGGLALFWREVTARVQAEQALEEIGARYRTLLASIDTGFAILEVLYDGDKRANDYRFLEANASFSLQTGLQNVVGHTARAMVPDLERFWIDTYAAVAESGVPTRFQHGSDAMGRFFDVFALRIGDASEHRVAVLFSDISAARAAARERDRLIETLAVERAQLADVFRQTPAFIAVLEGPEHVFRLVNDAYYQLVGHRAMIGLPVFEALPEVRGQGFDVLLDGVLATGEPFIGQSVPVMLARTPGAPPEQRLVDLTYTPMTGVGGVPTGIIAHGVDVTEQALARREIERLLAESESARAEAIAANRAKAEFLAVMSHELRTPLNAIDGYAELMELGIRGPISDEQRVDLARIRKSQKHLLGLINGVLNYAQVEAGAVHYDLETVPLDEVLATCEALVTPQTRKHGLTLRRQPCDPSITVHADREKLQQIVLNLLSNAIKFTDGSGRIEMRWVRTQDSRGPVVQIKVADTGIGIASNQLARIFEPFVQVDAELTRTREGTGLGLAISRDLARGMGGELTAESTIGAGSTFTLSLRGGMGGAVGATLAADVRPSL
ncbi:MAG: PAS domain-containing protein [Gemmatimonadota bacterium]